MTEIIHTLGIEWQQLLAQTVNFMIIMGVLTFFAYKPLLRTLDARRDRIRESMETADRIQRESKQLDSLRSEVLSKADAQSGVMLEKAKKDAESVKKEILDNARKEADDLLAKARQQVSDERRRFYEEVHSQLTGIIVSMTQKVLEREFSPADQKRIIASIEKELPKSAA